MGVTQEAARLGAQSKGSANRSQVVERFAARRFYMTPGYGLRTAGPFVAGAGIGAATGSRIWFSKVGLGGDAPERVVGLRTKPSSSPCPTPPRANKCTTPPRAKLGVDPTTQAVAVSSITVKTRAMLRTPPFEFADLALWIETSRDDSSIGRRSVSKPQRASSCDNGARHHMRNDV
jgi:hypothetical protein